MWRHCRHIGGQEQYIFSHLFSCKIVSLFQPSNMAAVKTLYTLVYLQIGNANIVIYCDETSVENNEINVCWWIFLIILSILTSLICIVYLFLQRESLCYRQLSLPLLSQLKLLVSNFPYYFQVNHIQVILIWPSPQITSCEDKYSAYSGICALTVFHWVLIRTGCHDHVRWVNLFFNF